MNCPVSRNPMKITLESVFMAKTGHWISSIEEYLESMVTLSFLGAAFLVDRPIIVTARGDDDYGTHQQHNRASGVCES